MQTNQDQKVLDYVQTHPRCDDAEISKALKIHEVDVLDSLVRLEKQGKVKSTN